MFATPSDIFSADPWPPILEWPILEIELMRFFFRLVSSDSNSHSLFLIFSFTIGGLGLSTSLLEARRLFWLLITS